MQNRFLLAVFMVSVLLFITSCVNSEQEINNLLNNPEFKAQMYEILENSCLNITKNENNYLVQYFKCGDYTLRNSTEGLILVKPVENYETITSTTTTTSTTTIERVIINIDEIPHNKTREYL